mmetsp:Transcript_20199/g.43902  ORF Transcript_20199/g.43902 Transcript_20199/m.43902 type:complete len:457 (+) Transcript_20199:66-1436(+)|eukprot:CAMPEP_0172302554 /NCGR_PEP_ID=MMETSP1058-20130122/4234_1 /TAXON_ID=83371 /ORGANISM="Detonula confervacea, Strain CCMP 353" /LENGTH=456 /DNA_ID=CAMNT_0013013069 /DNA_START=57 /DNA_END=1427 /DNA_ORIENTATION=+
MGNSSSTNVFLSVHESRTCITAGSTISGEIRCPDHSISNDIFSGVTLYFIGKEDVEVKYRESGHGTTGGGAKSKFAKRDIIRAIIPLDTSKNSVRAGSYPFQFHIPDQLPSSFRYKDGNGGYCSIRYKVKMHLMRGRDQEIPIEIVAKPPSAPIPSLAEPDTARIQFIHCIPQGSMTWAAGVDDTRVGVGENLTINLGMKNESLVKLERVSAKLKQTVEWRTSGHSSTDKSIIRSSSFSKTNSMKARSKDQLRLIKSRKMDGPLSQAAQPRTVYEEVIHTAQNGNNQLTFPIPEHACQSYTGRLIKIRHYVSIKAKTPSCFTSPKIHIPIEIVTPRNTPIVTARVIPMPSAPPLIPDDYLGASDVSSTMPYFSSTLLVQGAVVNDYEGEEEIILDPDERKPSMMTGAANQYSSNSEAPPPYDTGFEASEVLSPPAFDSRLIEPFLARDDLFDSRRV